MPSHHSSFVPFKNSWDRIERAKAHGEALAEAWNSLKPEELNAIVVHVDDDGTGSIRCIPIEDGIPARFSLQLGEMLYQLRAALDNLIYDAAIVDTGRNPPRTARNYEFPLCAKPDRFQKSAYKIAPLSDNRRALIEAVQTYNIPKLQPELLVFNYARSLMILNDWARWDRHRKLNFFQAWGVRARPLVRGPEGSHISLRKMKVNAWGSLKDKDEIATFRLDGFVPGMKIKANPDLFIDIAVDEAPAPCHPSDNFGNRIGAMITTVTWIAERIEHDLTPTELFIRR